MPELKHNFVQGRMNKDLDERIVPNGEYRDATNIQVSSSEDSDVGTIQNILGNVLVDSQNLYPEDAACIATIADEKNNKIYFFVQGKYKDPSDYFIDGDYSNFSSFRDLIIEYNQPSDLTSVGYLEPVFVDIYGAICHLNVEPVYQSLWTSNKYTLNIPTEGTAQEQTAVVKKGMEVSIYDPIGGVYSTHKVINSQLSSEFIAGTPGSDKLVEVELDKAIVGINAQMQLSFSSPKVLFPWDFNEASISYITGINIIDDLLFWTDNYGEPKKINIKHGKKGTVSVVGLPPFPTSIVHEEQFNYDNVASNFLPNNYIAEYRAQPVEEQHITVIKKSPKTAPTLEMHTNREDGINYSGLLTITTPAFINDSDILNSSGNSHAVNYDFSPYSIGDTIYLRIKSDLDGTTTFNLTEWETSISLGINPAVVLKEYTDSGTQPSVPVTDYRIKGNVTAWANANYDSANGDVKVAIVITSIDGFPPTANISTGNRDYAIDTFLDEEKLFEFKFPRFAYRWRYKDGEYSCFSPFSEIAFLPGTFDYHPKKGYNLGMVNRLKYVDIYNFFNRDHTPDDVVEIDILYKDENSTNIHVVKTIKSSDFIYIPSIATNVNHWEWNSFRLSSETVESTVASNQLLRPFDNVPKKALSQEVVGNRIVYGNYLQNFNLLESLDPEEPYNLSSFNFLLESNDIPYSFSGVKSIKSLREYQLGVVFTDEYDRQTPVISNATATVKLDKSYSWRSNNFSVSFNQSYPVNMDRFKFFIKETAEEYYNMAMDRFYDAEDGNIWLAFASSDRNKIDIDTFLILKKGLDEGVQVTETARYKVLAIENEAPDFIKTSKILISEESHSLTLNDIFGTSMSSAPGLNDSSFSVNYDVFHGTSGADMHEISDTLYVEFAQLSSDQVSNRYEVTELTCDWDGDGSTMPGSKYHFRIKGSFKSDVSFITDDATGLNSTSITPGTIMRVYRYKVENKPQFDGRFFVKILIDDVFSKYIKKVYEETGLDYKVVASTRLYKLPEDFSDNVWGNTPGVGFDSGNLAYNVLAHYKTQFKSWFQDYKFKNVATSQLGNSFIYEGSEQHDDNYWSWANSHCETTYGWTMYYHCSTDLTTGNFYQHSNATNFNTTPPPAYWFVDEGIFRGQRWDDDMYVKFGYVSPSSSVYQFSDDTSFDRNGNGLVPDPVNENWTLDLGFGGIWSQEWNWYQPGTSGDKHIESESSAVISGSGSFIANNDWHHTYENIVDFYKIGVTGGNPKHVNQSDVVSRLTPGQRFRFAEDPLKTIYTLKAGVDQNNRIRYRRNDEKMPEHPGNPGDYMVENVVGDWADSSSASYFSGDFIHPAAQLDSRFGTSERINTAFTNPANFTKNYGLTVEPEITWDPTTGTGGLITGGFDLTLTTPTSGLTCLSCGNASVPNDFQLVLDSILGLDATTGNNIQLTVGMALYSYVLTGTSTTISLPATGTTQQIMLIKTIVYDNATDKYHVGLTGSRYLHTSSQNFVPKINTSLKFGQPIMNGFSPIFIENYHHNIASVADSDVLVNSVGYTLEFIEPIDDIEIMPDDPAVWETEPKENTPLDIYYEATGSLPTKLNSSNFSSLLSVGTYTGSAFSSLNVFHAGTGVTEENIGFATAADGFSGPGLGLTLVQAGGASANPCVEPGGCVGGTVPEFVIGDEVIIPSHNVNVHIPIIGFDGVVNVGGDDYAEYVIVDVNLFRNGTFKPNWFNCYSFGNGVESNRIRDNFNLPYIKNGVKVSTTLATQYKEERRKYGLIYSGIYNSISGINNLNQFIQAEKITKDVNPSYGSIQKLFTRDSDLVTLCEDKVLRILANKDAVYNADGNPQLTATNNVLGQTIPFTGDYGISTNPESFASQSYRVYFTDRVRGAVLRLSRDGLTPISDHGMRDWFRDRMKISSAANNEFISEAKILGSYDDRQEEYNVTFSPTWNAADFTPRTNFNNSHEGLNTEQNNSYHSEAITVSFKESSKGWVSFKSFVPEHAVSGNNDYFTFKNSRMWKHHTPKTELGKVVNYNTFYGDDNFFISTFNVLLNGAPDVVKSFKTLNYEGSKSKSIKNIEDDQYHNLKNKKGWHVDAMFTNKEKGSLKEFIEKEGKWFNYITGKPISTSDTGHLVDGFDAGAFAVQGQGFLTVSPVVLGILGCTDNGLNLNGAGVVNDANGDNLAAFNYNPLATIDDSSCIDVVEGCTNPSAANYDANANTDDGSCIIYGCMDPTANNYDPDATADDGSCTYIVYGCTDPTMFNYDPNAGVDDGSCIAVVLGCMNPTATNYDPLANTDDGSCCLISGCTDLTACNYNPQACYDDGSCNFCNEDPISSGFPQAINFDGYEADGVTPLASCNAGCVYCVHDLNSLIITPSGTSISLQWTNPPTNTMPLYSPITSIVVEYENLTTSGPTTTINVTPTAAGVQNSYNITGLDPMSDYEISVVSTCNNTAFVDGVTSTVTTTGSGGCTDGAGTYNNVITPSGAPGTWGACNYDPTATVDDNSCEYTSCAGCTNSSYLEYNISGTGFDAAINQPLSSVAPSLGYCNTLIQLGCTDANAFNYDVNATVDDGSCCYVAGCMDVCANNYNPNACYDNNSCTYGLLCDGIFATINSASDQAVPIDENTGDSNGNSISNVAFNFAELPNYSELDVWREGVLPTSISNLPQTCGDWYKFYQPVSNKSDTTDGTGILGGLGNNETWRLRGPVNPGFNKILFESGCWGESANGSVVDYEDASSANGVYQAFNAPTTDNFELILVVDNWIGSGGGLAFPRPDGHFQFLVCNGDYPSGVQGGIQGQAYEGCIYIDNPIMGGPEFPVQMMNDTGLTGVSRFAPDGVEWSWSPSANCSGSAPCTGPAQAGVDLNTYSRQKSVKVGFQGMGPNTIIYIAYYSQHRFYRENGDRAYTTDQTFFGATTTTGQSSRACEVSSIQIVNADTGPCNPGSGNGGPVNTGPVLGIANPQLSDSNVSNLQAKALSNNNYQNK